MGARRHYAVLLPMTTRKAEGILTGRIKAVLENTYPKRASLPFAVLFYDRGKRVVVGEGVCDDILDSSEGR